MRIDTRSVFDQALALPPRKREELADTLLVSLEEKDLDRIQQEWLDEIERRVENLESGKVKLIPGEEVMQRIRKEVLGK